jgi:hypothetical protein
MPYTSIGMYFSLVYGWCIPLLFITADGQHNVRSNRVTSYLTQLRTPSVDVAPGVGGRSWALVILGCPPQQTLQATQYNNTMSFAIFNLCKYTNDYA